LLATDSQIDPEIVWAVITPTKGKNTGTVWLSILFLNYAIIHGEEE
jgi:hypothetical protein